MGPGVAAAECSRASLDAAHGSDRDAHPDERGDRTVLGPVGPGGRVDPFGRARGGVDGRERGRFDLRADGRILGAVAATAADAAAGWNRARRPGATVLDGLHDRRVLPGARHPQNAVIAIYPATAAALIAGEYLPTTSLAMNNPDCPPARSPFFPRKWVFRIGVFLAVLFCVEWGATTAFRYAATSRFL